MLTRTISIIYLYTHNIFIYIIYNIVFKEPPVLEWVESRRRLPWEKLKLFPDTPPSLDLEHDQYTVEKFKSRRLMEEMTDTFADSLRYVNRLYTRKYGHVSRKVPSHMPHFIQREVMESLQEKFQEEFDITSSHKVSLSSTWMLLLWLLFYM